MLTERAGLWATERIAGVEASVASTARRLGVVWATVWSAVGRHGRARVDDPDRVGATDMAGFDETVMSPAKRHRPRRFITAVVDVEVGQIIDVFDGRERADLDEWLSERPDAWLEGLQVVSVDPHEGYRSAIVGSERLGEVTVVVDPFHIVRLANTAVTRCRQRVQQDTLGHRGWKGDPLYGIRKLLLMAAERLDHIGWGRLRRALRHGDPDGEVQDTWVAKEYVRDI